MIPHDRSGRPRTQVSRPHPDQEKKTAVPSRPGRVSPADIPGLQRSIGNRAVSRLLAVEDRFRVGAGTVPVQRTLDYDPWSGKYIRDGGFMSLLREKDPGSPAKDIEAPFVSLVRQVEESGLTVEFSEEKPAQGRAAFLIKAGVGTLAIDPPPDSASAQELRAFATTLAHELQHAVDYTKKRFPSDKDAKYSANPLTAKGMAQIAAELRAFGVEGAAAAKLALGDEYPKRPFSTTVSNIDRLAISSEQRALVQEFQIIASYIADKRKPLEAFQAIKVGESKILDRLAAYLRQYRLAVDPDEADALEWLRSNPEVVDRGLAEGALLFHSRRPKLKQPTTTE